MIVTRVSFSHRDYILCITKVTCECICLWMIVTSILDFLFCISLHILGIGYQNRVVRQP